MIKCFIYKGVPVWCSFVETKWFWSAEGAQRYCDHVCPKLHGSGKYFYVISKWDGNMYPPAMGLGV